MKLANWKLEFLKHLHCSYLIWIICSCIAKATWQRVRSTRAPENGKVSASPKRESCVTKDFVKTSPDLLFVLHNSRLSPFFEITGKLLIIVCDQGAAWAKRILYATCRRRRRFLLYGAWLSHNAIDARMVKIVVAIVLESVGEDMSN